MILFVNNIPLHVLDHEVAPDFTAEIDLSKQDVLCGEITGRPLIRHASYRAILHFISFLQIAPGPDLDEVFFIVDSVAQFKLYLRNEIQCVKAAGGVVENYEGKILMMKRLGFWDLPKGKAEKGEKSAVTAIREVEEECNITVFKEKKLVTTWHTYMLKGKMVVKRTKWYRMQLISDSRMAPQTEEGIEELVWMAPAEVQCALKQSYRSIAHVVNCYFKDLAKGTQH